MHSNFSLDSVYFPRSGAPLPITPSIGYSYTINPEGRRETNYLIAERPKSEKGNHSTAENYENT